MKMMAEGVKRIVGVVVLLTASALTVPLAAQTGSHSHSSSHAQAGTSVPSDWVQGEVRRIDRENGRITLRHEAIKSLDMPPMTMVFRVSPDLLPQSLKPGDAVRFRVLGQDGQFTITDLSADR